MTTDFRLPDLGEGLTEAEIVQWLVAPGDTVALNQTLAEVETAKAIVELPSPYDGVVATLHAAAGDTVAVGAPLIALDIEGETGSAPRRTWSDMAPRRPAERDQRGVHAAPQGPRRPPSTPRCSRPHRTMLSRPGRSRRFRGSGRGRRRLCAHTPSGSASTSSWSPPRSAIGRSPGRMSMRTPSAWCPILPAYGLMRVHRSRHPPRASARRGFRSAAFESTPRRRWSKAPSPRRT